MLRDRTDPEWLLSPAIVDEQGWGPVEDVPEPLGDRIGEPAGVGEGRHAAREREASGPHRQVSALLEPGPLEPGSQSFGHIHAPA